MQVLIFKTKRKIFAGYVIINSNFSLESLFSKILIIYKISFFEINVNEYTIILWECIITKIVNIKDSSLQQMKIIIIHKMISILIIINYIFNQYFSFIIINEELLYIQNWQKAYIELLLLYMNHFLKLALNILKNILLNIF